MSWLVAVVLSAASVEQSAIAAVHERFETAGRSRPADDARLAVAARSLAQLAVEKTAGDAAGLLAVTDAVSIAGGWDASPTAILLKASRETVLEELGKLTSVAAEPASALGIGVAEKGDRVAVCILLAQRKIELAPIARRHAKPPKNVTVCGTLVAPLETAELFVTSPAGAVTRFAMSATSFGHCGTFKPANGRSVVEVLARGPKGPEVAALFFIDVGASVATADQQIVEPASPDEARRAVFLRINALRKTMGLAPVVLDRALEKIAQRYAEKMASEGFFAHVDPSGGDLKSRLAAGQYRFSAAGENLGASNGPLAAHFGIEHSPGHRSNLLEPAHRALGLGLATRASDGVTLLVQVLASPIDDGGPDPVGAAYQAIDEHRARKNLKPLKRHAVLEALAQEHARRCLSRDLLSAELSDGRKLHERVFEAMTTSREASIDLAIVESPMLVPASKNLADPRYSAMGLGLARGDSAKYGNDKLWLVVIYASEAAGEDPEKPEHAGAPTR
ncbi:MAG: CAP domain-containing protein [Myxococcales bacterium]|nr:CAP domain-containing protein [Myxococcales bacterium]